MEVKLATHIPRSERELATVKEGELVLVSILSASGRNSVWTIFTGNKHGLDTFIAQEFETQGGDMPLVAVYSAHRQTHQFDRNLGVLLSQSYQLNFFGPRRYEYNSMVEQLKQANLWREQ